VRSAGGVVAGAAATRSTAFCGAVPAAAQASTAFGMMIDSQNSSAIALSNLGSRRDTRMRLPGPAACPSVSGFQPPALRVKMSRRDWKPRSQRSTIAAGELAGVAVEDVGGEEFDEALLCALAGGCDEGPVSGSGSLIAPCPPSSHTTPRRLEIDAAPPFGLDRKHFASHLVRGFGLAFSEHWFNANREANYHARFFPSPNIHVQEIPQA
jgi:hypothetical protein